MDRLNMANRNSTPETTSTSLRPPSQRPTMAGGHHLRSSADFGGQPHSARGRPASEVYYNQNQQGRQTTDESSDQAAQKWISDIDSYENTLEEMAAATCDQDFKDELTAIEQWFKVLSEAERTAALYALLQQATAIQTRFFIGVLQEMAKKHPVSGVLSPSSFRDNPMSNRLSDAFSKMNVGETSRGSFAGSRPPISPGPKRSSGLDQDQIYNMFPEAAAAIETQKSDFRQKTGTEPRSNRSSAAIGERSSLAAPSINAPGDDARRPSLAQPSPWGQRNTESQAAISRPKSSSGQQPMGQFANPPPSAGPRSSRLPITGDNNIQSTTLNAPEQNQAIPMISPLTAGGNWGSMMNTPMVPNFNQPDGASNANMVANATAMKLASLSTINNRVQLDDARKYRRSRSQEGRGNQPTSPVPGSAGFPNDFVMTNGMGQMLSPQQAAMAMQAQQLAAMNGQQQRSRPSSPGVTLPGHGMANVNLAGASNNGFLAAYNNQGGMFNGGLSSFGSEGYLSDGNEIQRGRSPRGKRGTSRPPEDPTNPELLNDIPAWLRSLRLHKYTDNLKNIKWTDLVQMDEADLEKHGVAAQGARRKMIKVFEEVRAAQAQGKV